MERPLRVHVISETAFAIQGQGVHSAFVECVELLRAKGDVEVVVNGEGWGEVLHAHSYGPYYFWKGRRYKGRRVFTAHVVPESVIESLPLWRLWMPVARWYFRKVYNYADVCIAVSPEVEEAIRALGVRSRIVQIPNPIDLDRFAQSPELRAQFRKRFLLPEDAFVVLGVGQLEGRKGVDDFLDVAAACPDLTFVWVGGRPFGVMTEGLVRINRRIAQAGPNVRCVGMVPYEDMPGVYNAADMLLFPSKQETFGLVPLEAAAVGLPVVLRDLPVFRGIYRQPYLAASTTSEFVTLTQRLASDSAFYAQAREMSRALVAPFDRWVVRDRLLSLYREVIATAEERALKGGRRRLLRAA